MSNNEYLKATKEHLNMTYGVASSQNIDSMKIIEFDIRQIILRQVCNENVSRETFQRVIDYIDITVKAGIISKRKALKYFSQLSLLSDIETERSNRR